MTTETDLLDTDGFHFWRSQLELLGDDDPIEVLAATPDRLDERFREVPDTAVRRAAIAGKWTPIQILGHLVDIEWVFAFRTRVSLCDPEPSYAGIDQDRWVAVQRHADADPVRLLADFRALRQVTVRFWRDRTDAELERAGLHETAGVSIPLGMLLRIQAGHDLNHLEQLGRYIPMNVEAVG